MKRESADVIYHYQTFGNIISIQEPVQYRNRIIIVIIITIASAMLAKHGIVIIGVHPCVCVGVCPFAQ